MTGPVPAALSAPRHREQARAAFKRRDHEVAAWLHGRPGLRITGRPPGPDDVHSQQNIVLTGEHDDHGDVIVKVFAATAGDCVRAETAALARYSGFGLPVPAVLSQQTAALSDGTGCHVLILTALPGAPLSQVLPANGTATAAAAGTTVGQLLTAQYRAERLPVATAGVAAASWGRVRARYEQTLTDELGVPAELLTAMDDRARYLPDPPTLGWVTFDWRLRHLLWDGQAITGLLDLEYAKPYDSRIEPGNLHHDLVTGLDPDRRQAFSQALLGAYRQDVPEGDAGGDGVLLFYMARQALNHAAVKRWQGVTDNRLATEARLVSTYLGADNVAGALTAAATRVPRPRRQREHPRSPTPSGSVSHAGP